MSYEGLFVTRGGCMSDKPIERMTAKELIDLSKEFARYERNLNLSQIYAIEDELVAGGELSEEGFKDLQNLVMQFDMLNKIHMKRMRGR